MDDIIYVSQKEAIDRNAIKKGISLKDVLDYSSKTLEKARRDWPARSNMWYLSLVENFVWENFCKSLHLSTMIYTDKLLVPSEPFPGKLAIPLADVTATKNNPPKKPEHVTFTQPVAAIQPATSAKPTVKVEPVLKVEPATKSEPIWNIVTPRGSALHRSDNRDWLHDLYDGDRTLGRAERSTGDYWPSRVGGPAREGDFYRPSVARNSENSKPGEQSKPKSLPFEETREHYGRLSRPDLDAVHPTKSSSSDSKYDSQERLIWKNTAAFGVSRLSVAKAFQEEGVKVKTSYPAKGSDWQKWATEWAVWSRFCQLSRFLTIQIAVLTYL